MAKEKTGWASSALLSGKNVDSASERISQAPARLEKHIISVK